MRKPVFEVFGQVQHKPGCTATGDGYRLEISDLGSIGIVLLGYTTLNIHEIWLRLFRGEHSLYIRAKMTSFVNSHD